MNIYMLTRKKGKLFVFFFSLLLLVAVFALLSNENTVAPVFSQESGFYEEEFYLTIEAEEGTSVYYTLDGSTPDETSYKYDSPIYIDNASLHENVYSMRTDTSVGFYTDLIEKYETRDADPEYKTPDFLVDKCTIIRAVAIGKMGGKSDVITKTYYVGISPKQYDGCNIISIIAEPEDLFGKEKGIYVTGQVFEEYLEDGEMDENWRFWDSNYTQRGMDWEREAVFQMFDSKGELLVSKTGGVRTRGGVSRGTLPRGLNLYARAEYDNQETFGITMFDSEFEPSSISLTSGGNQITTQFSDYMMTQRTRGLNYATMEFEPYVLFLNGEYWGFYWMAERYDESYLEYHYDVEASQVVIVKNSEIEAGEDKDILLFRDLVSFMETHDMTVEENYQKAQDMVDMDSLIDYYATMIYIARSSDWPLDNTALWRTREKGDGEYADGRWRWMLFDCNSMSMRNDKDLVPHDTLNYVIERDGVFASLWENPDFKERFEERILYIADQCFDAGEMNQFIAQYNEQMVPILSKTWKRFHGSDNNKLDEYNSRMESYRIFFMNRKETVESWFE